MIWGALMGERGLIQMLLKRGPRYPSTQPTKVVVFLIAKAYKYAQDLEALDVHQMHKIRLKPYGRVNLEGTQVNSTSLLS